MKICGLISGGKDSVFNLMQCVANGHEIIVLANLYPPSGGEQELDSFMFQSVGVSVVEAIAECMHLPLIRREIRGKPVNTDAQYCSVATGEDEVEDLYNLLADVCREYPEVEAVASGAILSNYQRVRVEYACSRLQLSSLAYLWQQDQRILLRQMIDSGLNAVVVKVAGMGLSKRHLGRRINDELYQELCALNDKYGLHVAGEGGEYETITLDCPLFRYKCIELIEQQPPVVHSKDAFAPVLYLTVSKWRLVDKPPEQHRRVNDASDWIDILLKPRLLCDAGYYGSAVESAVTLAPRRPNETYSTTTTIRAGKDWMVIAGIMVSSESRLSAEQEMEEIIEKQLKHLLRQHGAYELSDIAQCRLYLKSMDDFADCNRAYQRHFGLNHPPTRVCLSLGGDRMSRKCVLDVVLSRLTGTRLHVQSISYWAPANIGPYSQAMVATKRITHGEREDDDSNKISSSSSSNLSVIYVAGQIGLIPETMQLASGLDRQIRLSLQHVASIVFAILHNDQSAITPSISDLFRLRQKQVGCYQRLSASSPLILCIGYADREEHLSPMHSHLRKAIGDNTLVPLLLIAVDTLPRKAACEWETLVFHPKTKVSFRSDSSSTDSDDDDDDEVEKSLSSFHYHRGSAAARTEDGHTWYIDWQVMELQQTSSSTSSSTTNNSVPLSGVLIISRHDNPDSDELKWKSSPGKLVRLIEKAADIRCFQSIGNSDDDAGLETALKSHVGQRHCSRLRQVSPISVSAIQSPIIERPSYADRLWAYTLVI